MTDIPRLQVVVLGSTGFIGSAVLRALATSGVTRSVHALVRNPDDVVRLEGPRDVRVVPGDLQVPPPGLFPADPHVVIHLANKQIDSDGAGFEVNVAAARALVDALPQSTKGILYASSASVYGQGEHVGIDELAPVAPDTSLARSRLQVERIIQEWARPRHVAAYCLRARLVFGAGDRYTLPGLVGMIGRGFQPGSGRQRYTVLDVDDYARVLLALMAHIEGGTPAEQASLNAGYTRSLSLNEIVDAISRRYALPPPRFRAPVAPWIMRGLRQLPWRASSTLATRMELFGLTHTYSVESLRRRIGAEILDCDPLACFESALRRTREQSNGRSAC